MNPIALPQNAHFHNHAKALTQLLGNAEGYTIFCRKDGEKWQQLGALSATQAFKIYDIIPREEMVDMYFTVNTFYRIGPEMKNGLRKVYNKQTTKAGIELPGSRQEVNLQDLRCLYVDMDLYRNSAPINWRDASNLVMKLADKGKIPQPSFFASSGRGAYAVWTITPHESKFWDLMNYKALNRALYREFEAYSALLEPDDVYDGSRVLRLPGSINSKAPDNQVCYVVQYGSDGRPFEYTLEGVAAKLRVELIAPPPKPAHSLTPPAATAVVPALALAPAPKPRKTRVYDADARKSMKAGGRAGMKALGLRRMDELLEIIRFKRVRQGFRYKTLFIVASTARIAGLNRTEAISILEDLAVDFLPPYPGTDANDIAVSEIALAAYTRFIKKHTATGLARFFNLSTADCRHLLLRTIYTEDIALIKNAPKRADRKKLENAICEEAPFSTGLLDLCRRLFARHALSLSKSQASRYVRRLGLKIGHRAAAIAA